MTLEVFFNFLIIKYMKIKNYQTSKAIPFFDDKLKIYKINSKLNNSEPTIFFGMYNSADYNSLLKNKSNFKIILWGGTDLILLRDKLVKKINVEIIEKIIKNNKTIFHICQSQDHYNILNQMGYNNIFYKKLFLTDNLDIVKKLTNICEYGKNIYAYDGNGKAQVYNKNILKIIQKKLPQFNFIYSSECKNKNINQQDMPDIYQKCFIALRLTDYDGNGMTVFECGLAGIPTIHNGDFPLSINWSKNNIEKIISNIIEVSNWKIEQRNNLKKKYKELFDNAIKDDWTYAQFYT